MHFIINPDLALSVAKRQLKWVDLSWDILQHGTWFMIVKNMFSKLLLNVVALMSAHKFQIT